ncbi:MAG: sugar ABC transporter permease [Eubacteriales bacterium]|nr:sugar ABC transporter permease [Eubacteriales bacterium]
MKKKKLNYAKWGYIFCAPATIAFLIFSLYPIFFTTILGFTDFKGMTATTFHFLKEPFANFQAILNSELFKKALGNTFVMWICNFIPQILLALLLAAMFSRTHNKLKGQGGFKVLMYMPNIITAATIAILFNAFFGYPMGPINDIFQKLGWSAGPVEFLRSKTTARGVVSFIQFWMWYGYTMIVLLSGILGISPEIFESAEIDGANGWQTFWQITIPNIKTILLFTLVTSLIGGLQMFDIPKLFLLGGPDNATLTTSVFIYNQAFSGSYLYNRASAASLIMFLIICVLSAIMFFMLRDKDEVALNKLMKQKEKEYRKAMKEKAKGGNN